eukprot:scaffold19558_cov94-Skeletonema_dohrnii-CCMP3373.AAC.3
MMLCLNSLDLAGSVMHHAGAAIVACPRSVFSLHLNFEASQHGSSPLSESEGECGCGTCLELAQQNQLKDIVIMYIKQVHYSTLNYDNVKQQLNFVMHTS